eukprot:TRINITY_DN28582_c0_g1_i1.p1 TRINITY_DN28582_c0_g1~~TRINITY_DN28582_c0_g1_i1.p1  ORF type:complete len:103 (-),score=38.62 TRINITY_DN28582_c0_g1_i1:73-381(-)
MHCTRRTSYAVFLLIFALIFEVQHSFAYPLLTAEGRKARDLAAAIDRGNDASTTAAATAATAAIDRDSDATAATAATAATTTATTAATSVQAKHGQIAKMLS